MFNRFRYRISRFGKVFQGIERMIALAASYIAAMGSEMLGLDDESRLALWAGSDQAQRLVPVSKDQFSMNRGGFMSNHGA